MTSNIFFYKIFNFRGYYISFNGLKMIINYLINHYLYIKREECGINTAGSFEYSRFSVFDYTAG